MDRLTEMEAFATVVDQGGFTDAAKKLGMSKSAVSKHVTSLEARLGARLLNRTTRRVSPTEIGLAYYDRARRVLTDAGEADALVSAFQAVPSGHLKVAVDADFGATCMPPLIAEFLSKYPKITVNMQLTRGLGARRTAGIEDGFDLAIRVGGPRDTNYDRHPLAETSLRLVAAPEYLAEHGHPERIEDLSNHQLLHYSQDAVGSVWHLTAPSGELRQVRTSGWLTVNDGPSLLRACISGLGIAQLPSFLCAEALAQGTVEQALPDLPRVTQQIYAMKPEAKVSPPKVHAFLDFLTDKLAQRAWEVS